MLRLIIRRTILPVAAAIVLWVERHWPNEADLYDPDAPVPFWPVVPDDARELAP